MQGSHLKIPKGMMHPSRKCNFLPKQLNQAQFLWPWIHHLAPGFTIVNQNFLHWQGIILTTGRGLTENILPLNGGQKSAVNIICKTKLYNLH